MRFFEILIFLHLFAAFVVLFLKIKGRHLRIFYLIGSVVLLSCHLVLEGARWQMYPVYLISLLVFLIFLRSIFVSEGNRNASPSRTKRVMRYTGISLAFLLLLFSLIPPVILPVFKINEPSGPLKVGCTTIYFWDTTRMDVFSNDPNAYRELSVRVWYPADPEKDMQRLSYMKEDEAGYMSQFIIGPKFLLSHFNLVKTHSYENAPPRAESYPVILYSPSGDMVQNTSVFQELASHGYVVFSVGHPYWNAFYYDHSGQAVPFDKNNDYYQAMWEEETSDTVNQVKELITVERDLDTKRMLQQKLNLIMPLEVADIKLWAEDLSFLLDQIESGDPSFGRLLDLMDVSRVGVIGFSKGGAAAGQFAVTDSRCRAGINLSGFMFGDVVDSGLEIPFMILENKEEWCQDCQPICEVLYEDSKSDAYMVRIEGARHGNFSDWSLVGKFLQLSGVIGPINGSRCLEIQKNYILSFFDRYLKGIESPLLTAFHPDYPEVQFNSR